MNVQHPRQDPRVKEIREKYTAKDGWFYHDLAFLLTKCDHLATERGQQTERADQLAERAHAAEAALAEARSEGFCDGIVWTEKQKVEVWVKALEDKVRRVEALAEEWGADNGILNPASRHTRDVMLRELRAALATPEAKS